MVTALILLVLLVPACATGEEEPASAEPTIPVEQEDTAGAPDSEAPAADTGSDLVAQVENSSDFCEAMQAVNEYALTTTAETPEDLLRYLETIDAVWAALAEQAPDEITEEIAVMAEGQSARWATLAEMAPQMDDIEAIQDPQLQEQLDAIFSNEELQAANAPVTQWEAENC